MGHRPDQRSHRRAGFAKISDSPSSGSHWHLQALLLGGAALLGGFAPGWAIGRFITDTGTLYNDRFGLAAMFGTSILLVAFLDWALRPGKPQKILVCLLIGLATAQQARTATLYRWSWEEQRQIFWQLKWRAPDIQPYTAVFGNGALAQYMGSWANISALNLLYFQDIPDPAYTWYFDLYRYPIARFVEEKGENYRREKTSWSIARRQARVWSSSMTWWRINASGWSPKPTGTTLTWKKSCARHCRFPTFPASCRQKLSRSRENLWRRAA